MQNGRKRENTHTPFKVHVIIARTFGINQNSNCAQNERNDGLTQYIKIKTMKNWARERSLLYFDLAYYDIVRCARIMMCKEQK